MAIRAALDLHRPDAVLHFAALAYVGESVEQPGAYYHNNLVGSLSLLQEMERAGVSRLVFSSSCATYGVGCGVPIDELDPQEPVNPYGATKLFAERMIEDFSRSSGLRFAILRYFNAAGADESGELLEEHVPETHLIPLVLQTAAGLRGHLNVFGYQHQTIDGTCVRDYIHVQDLAKAHVLALRALSENASNVKVQIPI